MVEGRMELQDQLRDYQFQGALHSKYSFLNFIINTYEDKILPIVEDVGKPKPG